MTKYRVLASAFSCDPGGGPALGAGEDILGWSLVKQVARFNEVWALTYAKNRSSIEDALKEHPIQNLQFCYIDLPSWLRPLLRIQGGHQLYYYLWQIKAYFAAKKLHRRLRFELFHHITYANDWMASFIGALLPIPYVRGPGGGAHRTPRGFEQEYAVGGRLWEKVRSLGQWLFRHDPFFIRGQSRARAILVCSQQAASNVPARWAHKVQLYPVNGISSADLAIADQKRDGSGPFRVLSAGSLIRVKGFSLAIKAFKEFSAKHPHSEFSIVGSGPEESRLRTVVERHQLRSQVRLDPAVPRDELLARMAACDVFLFPSLRDGGGAVVIEAMSAGKPVVCLDAGGPAMHVTEACGIKIEPRSPEDAAHALAEALERLHMDETLRSKLGKAGRERAEQMYHWDRLGERMIEIYRHAAGTGGAG